jgi:periplasmic protein TonB
MKSLFIAFLLLFFNNVHAQEDTTIYGFAESGPALSVQMEPTFMGGSQMLQFYMNRDLVYPKDAKKKQIEGTVEIEFVVEQTGWSDQIKIIHSVYPSLDAEAIKFIHNLQWIPASNHNRDVRFRERKFIDFDLSTQN